APKPNKSLGELLQEALREADLIQQPKPPPNAKPPPPPRPPSAAPAARSPRRKEPEERSVSRHRQERMARQEKRDTRRAKERAAREAHRYSAATARRAEPIIEVIEEIPTAPGAVAQSGRDALRRLLGSREGLRMAVVLRETLGDPVSLTGPRQ
ncbi:MAG: hypothetical protein KDA32_05450, partial [Phycisphaerales bacterium]|nr:hypothetical protein [Phycisphaerales bacterium]